MERLKRKYQAYKSVTLMQNATHIDGAAMTGKRQALPLNQQKVIYGELFTVEYQIENQKEDDKEAD